MAETMKPESLFEDTGENTVIDVPDELQLSGWVKGTGNSIYIASTTRPQKLHVQIHGDGNIVRIGYKALLNGLRIEIGSAKYRSDHTTLTIGDGFSIASRGRFLLPNSGNRVEIGHRCMFSNEITIRGGEYPHLIFDRGTGHYLDVSDGIFIGDHVWVGEKAYINKSVTIPDNCIVGALSVLTKRYPESHCVIAGNPARVVKENVVWMGNVRELEPDSAERKSFETARHRATDK